MPRLRIWRVIVGTLVGTLTATLALFAGLVLAEVLMGQTGSLPYLLDPSSRLVFFANFILCALLPSILAAVIGILLGLGVQCLSKRASLAAIAIAGIIGAVISTLIWTCVTHNAQGPNPLMLAGFVVSSLLAPLVTVWLPKPKR